MPSKSLTSRKESAIQQRVASLPGKTGLSRVDFSKRLGKADTDLTRGEESAADLAWSDALLLADTFGVNLRWLATGEEPVFGPMALCDSHRQIRAELPFREVYEKQLESFAKTYHEMAAWLLPGGKPEELSAEAKRSWDLLLPTAVEHLLKQGTSWEDLQTLLVHLAASFYAIFCGEPLSPKENLPALAHSPENSAYPLPPAPADYKAIWPVLSLKKFQPGSSIRRQITAHLRSLILSGKITVHTRLPPIRDLASLWNTDYSSVRGALGMLAKEGLIVQSPKKGTFVAPVRKQLRRVCLYHNERPNLDFQRGFFFSLSLCLQRLLSERGIAAINFFDEREAKQLHQAPPEIRNMARDGEIDALIATGIYPEDVGWLLRLGIPSTSIMSDPHGAEVGIDHARFAELTVEEAVKRKRKRIGLVLTPGPERAKIILEFERFAANEGIAILISPNISTPASTTFGWIGETLANGLLDESPVPDLVFVYPDSLATGVFNALLKRQIEVPKDLIVVSHRNAETENYTPVPVVWLTVKVEDFAIGLLENIDRLMTGEQPRATQVPVSKIEDKKASHIAALATSA